MEKELTTQAFRYQFDYNLMDKIEKLQIPV